MPGSQGNSDPGPILRKLQIKRVGKWGGGNAVGSGQTQKTHCQLDLSQESIFLHCLLCPQPLLFGVPTNIRETKSTAAILPSALTYQEEPLNFIVMLYSDARPLSPGRSSTTGDWHGL